MEFYYGDTDRDVLILRADGGLDSHNSGQFVEDLQRLVEAGARKLVVDCARLGYISSVGIATLIRMHKRLADLKALGVTILNTEVDKSTHQDRKLLTGSSPFAANNLGKLAAETLLAEMATA